MGVSSLVLFAAAAACGSTKSGGADTGVATQGGAPAAAAVPTFTKSQFASVRWLDGKWRGVATNGKPFFEAYRHVNDSTMHQGTFSDSTFKVQTDSAIVAFRAGKVIDQGNGPPWVATHLDSAGVMFVLPRTPTSRIVWLRHSPDEWEAQIYTPDKLGQVQRVVYHMKRAAP
jgi:hypothetical protein